MEYLGSGDRDIFVDAMLEVDTAVFLKQFQDGMHLMDDLLAISNLQLPEFIFLDINMPRKSGFEYLEEIRNHENLKDVNVIMLSYEKLKFLIEDVLSINLITTLEENRKFLLI